MDPHSIVSQVFIGKSISANCGWVVGGGWVTDCDHILWDVEQIPRIDNHHSIANTSLRCVAEPPRLQLLCKFTILPLYAPVESGSEVSNHNEIR